MLQIQYFQRFKTAQCREFALLYCLLSQSQTIRGFHATTRPHRAPRFIRTHFPLTCTIVLFFLPRHTRVRNQSACCSPPEFRDSPHSLAYFRKAAHGPAHPSQLRKLQKAPAIHSRREVALHGRSYADSGLLAGAESGRRHKTLSTRTTSPYILPEIRGSSGMA